MAIVTKNLHEFGPQVEACATTVNDEDGLALLDEEGNSICEEELVPEYETTAKLIEGDVSHTPREAYYPTIPNQREVWSPDGQNFTFAAFLKHPTDQSNFNSEILWAGNVQIYFRRWNADPSLINSNSFLIHAYDAINDGWTGETHGKTDGAGTPISGLTKGEWFALMFSINYTGADPSVKIYTHRVGQASAVDINDGPLWAYDPGPINMDFTGAAISGLWDAGIGFRINGTVDFDISEVFMDDSYVDWSIAANRAKYLDANTGKPVGLGPTGSALTGSQPRYYAPDGDMTNNLGSEDNWTAEGTISNSATSPTD